MKMQRLCSVYIYKKELSPIKEKKIHDWNETNESKMSDSLRNKCKIHYVIRERDERHGIRGSTENTKESALKRVRESREPVLSRSPLRGTSMQDETRMHVSVQRSTSSKKETKQK